MRFEQNDIVLWSGDGDAVLPEQLIAPDGEAIIKVAVQATGEDHRVQVLYRVNRGMPVRSVGARRLWKDPYTDTQYYRARLPSLTPGDQVEYVALVYRAGRWMPSPSTPSLQSFFGKRASGDRGGGESEGPKQAQDPERRADENRQSFHFNLSHIRHQNELTLHLCSKSYRLNAHGRETRRKHRQLNPLLRLIPDQQLTHYVEAVPVPADAVALMQVTSRRDLEGEMIDALALMSIYVPQGCWQALRRQKIGLRDGASPRIHQKLARYGVTSEQFLAELGDDGFDDPEYPAQIDTFKDATDASVALLFHHPSLLSLKPSTAQFLISECIQPALDSSPGLPIMILNLGDQWVEEVPVEEDGQPIYANGRKVMTRRVDPNVLASMASPLGDAIKRSRQMEALAGELWTVQPGIMSSDYNAKTDAPVGSLPTQRDELGLGSESADPYRWTLKNLTPGHGLTVSPDVSYKAPPSEKTFRATGIWSAEDSTEAGALTEDLARATLEGRVHVIISTPDHVEGMIAGKLEVQGTVADNEPVRLQAILDGKNMSPPVATAATGSGSFTLNGTRTGLTYQLTAQQLGASASAGFYRLEPGQSPRLLRSFPLTNVSGYGTLSVSCKNHWLRHLGAYVQWLDEAGNPIEPEEWDEVLPEFLHAVFQPDKTKKFIELVSPVGQIFGIPISPDATVLDIPISDNVHTVRIFWGGLGSGSFDADLCPIGLVLTVIVELALPMILLVGGIAVMNSRPVIKLLEDKETLFAVCTVGAFLAAGPISADIALAQNPLKAIKNLALKLGPMLAKPALKGFGKWLAEQIGEGVAEKAIPFIDIASEVFNGLVTAAQLSETIIEVLESPFVYETDLTRSIGLSVTIVPDSRYGKFPDYHDHYRIVVIYDSGATAPVYEASLPGTTLSDPITIEFKAIPAGGELKIYAFFYAANGWQSGQGETPWMAARGTDGTSLLTVDGLMITTNQIPLGNKSVFTHVQKTGFQNGQHCWISAPDEPPTATLFSNPTNQDPDKQILEWRALTLAQSPAMVGSCWQARGLNQPEDHGSARSNDAMSTVQNLSILQHPETGFAIPAVGFSAASGISYDIASSNDGTGRSFFIDPTQGIFDPVKNPRGGFHLRRLSLQRDGRPNFATATHQSWGRFPLAMDTICLHPQGFVFGISLQANKIFRLKLPREAMPDEKAPLANQASGEGSRDGLLYGPQGMALALDGRLLILEGVNHRIQAFDVYGNPVPYFTKTDGKAQSTEYAPPRGTEDKVPTMQLVEAETSHYLDLSVQSRGYIFVLAYHGDGKSADNYRVDVYRPDGAYLVSTPGVAAAKIAVSLLNNLFTLNYEVIRGPEMTPGDGGRPEPSVSLWEPPPPASR